MKEWKLLLNNKIYIQYYTFKKINNIKNEKKIKKWPTEKKNHYLIVYFYIKK